MLLAFDGVHSRARALILPDCASPRYTGFLGIGGFAEAGSVAPTDPQDTHRLNFGVGSRFQFGYAMVSSTPTRWGWWTHLPQEQELTRAELQGIPEDVLRDRVLAAFNGWHLPVEPLVSNTAKIMRTAIYDVPSLPRWHVGRVMLLGDAAHAMSPAGGQGASLALEDAMLVGQFLADRSGSVTEAFAKAESVQRLRAERAVKHAAEKTDARSRNSGGSASGSGTEYSRCSRRLLRANSGGSTQPSNICVSPIYLGFPRELEMSCEERWGIGCWPDYLNEASRRIQFVDINF